MPGWLLPALLLGGAFGSGALTGRKGDRTQTTESAYDRWTEYQPDIAYRGLQDEMMQLVRDRLTSAVPMAGYEAGGITDINRAYELTGQNLKNRLVSQGLYGSPVAGAAAATMEAGRGGSIAKFLTELPLIERQLQQQDWANALDFLKTRPVNVRETGTSTGKTVYPGSVLGGGISDLFSMLGFLMGKGLIGGPKEPKVYSV